MEKIHHTTKGTCQGAVFFLHLLSISLLQTLGSPRGAKYITLVNRSPFCPLKRERERDKFPPNTCSLRSLLRYIILIHHRTCLQTNRRCWKEILEIPQKMQPLNPFSASGQFSFTLSQYNNGPLEMLVESIYPPKPLLLHYGNQGKKTVHPEFATTKIKEWNEVI